MRVYEFAKKHNVSNKELIKLLNDHSFEVASHMAVLSDGAADFLEKFFDKSNEKIKAVEKVSDTPVVPQSSLVQEAQEPVSPDVSHPRHKSLNKQKIESSSQTSLFTVAPMTVGEFADKAKKAVAEVILWLLKKGVVATKNKVVSEEVIAQLAQHYEMEIATKVNQSPAASQQSALSSRFGVTAGAKQATRAPIVVVIGHVDHGKTTLLDFVRKTRVAAREKGGITQHLGAYEVGTSTGTVVFLDTPGHEAFTLIRSRGIKVADIAVLVVAVDDGIMPQTVEAIRTAQSSNIPVIVALNKIDKVSPQQIDKVKQSLSSYGLTTEEWGGQTIMIPISAKSGQGVDTLVEMISLQAQMMDLVANPDVAACGFVLESKVEKGLGFVATVICQQGTLHVGDYVAGGNTQGKVSSLTDAFGKRLKEVGPSIPVQVAGFDQLPRVGEAFRVVSFVDYKSKRQERGSSTIGERPQLSAVATTDQVLNIIIKTDNFSTLEALLGALTKMSGKVFKECHVVHGAVGTITESDVMLAENTKSLIYGLHTRIESNALQLASKGKVTIKTFDIIYKMIEDLERVAEEGRPVKMVLKKTGEAVVLKIFDIKGLGVIAGAYVKSGICSRTGKVAVWRGKYKIGEGPIKSLQRDKKTVKEVHMGFECAFLVDGFSDWQVDDRVECYTETAEV